MRGKSLAYKRLLLDPCLLLPGDKYSQVASTFLGERRDNFGGFCGRQEAEVKSHRYSLA